MNDADLSPSYMGRCDLCGKPIDMEHAGDILTIIDLEGGFEDDLYEDIPDADEQFADSIVRSLESEHIYQHPYDGLLADAIRENMGFKVHDRCLEKTAWHLFEVREDDDG